MKGLLSIIAMLLLCSCAGAPTVQSSINGNTYSPGPTSADDPRLRSPAFYMNDDKVPQQHSSAPGSSQFRAVDNFCAANCQTRGGSADYCSRACGF